MLGGQEPVLIFQFAKLTSTALSDALSKIPLVSDIASAEAISQPPIPLYLSEQLTGLYIDSEEKNVDIETETESLSSGDAPIVNQKSINSSVTVNITGKKTSLGIALLSAMIDLIYEKVTSKEYAVTYLSGATTIFRAVLQSYSVSQNSDNELVTIRIQLSRGQKQPKPESPVVSVPGVEGTTPL